MTAALPSPWHPGLLADRLRHDRLTLVLCGPSAARDAMLRRALMPLLLASRMAEGDTVVALRFDTWGLLPLQALREQIDRVVPAAAPDTPAATLADQLLAAAAGHRMRLLLVLDAFERHLREPAERSDIARFDLELTDCITRSDVPMHVLMVVDEAMQPALQRYSAWVPDFGRDAWRMQEAPDDAALWSDTDIDPDAYPHDDASEPHADEWALDLSLDEPAQAPPATDERVGDSPAAPPSPLDLALDEPDVPPPVSAPAPAPAMPPDASMPSRGAMPVAPPRSAPPPSVPATMPSPAAPPVPPTTGGRAPFPRAAPTEAAWLGAGMASGSAQAPPWQTDPDAQTMQRTQRPARWWQGGARVVADVVALLAAMGLVATWIIGNDRPALRATRATPDAEVARAPAASTQATAPTAPPAKAPAAPLSPQAAAPPTLTIAMPIDGGAAATAIDELMRFVAAPAGITLNLVGTSAPATLAVWRLDALAAARAANAQPPLRVLAPLFSEQIQVIVRNDAPWDYLHQIKGLRLNIGRPEGARARTARMLYQQLFGAALPADAANELDEGDALQEMLRRGGPIDAMIVVSDAPLMNRLPAKAREQLRELPFDANDPRTTGALQSYALQRRGSRERARLSVISFLVTGAAPHPLEATLRKLVVALCRAQPALQAKGAALLRGFAIGEQPAAPWPYVLPRSAGSDCPAPDGPRESSNAPERQRSVQR